MYTKQKPGLHSMQLTIPHAIYGTCDFLAPAPIRLWLYKQGLTDWGLSHKTSSGTGYTDGVTNHCSVYMVYNIRPEDATVFKIQFPDVEIYLSDVRG